MIEKPFGTRLERGDGAESPGARRCSTSRRSFASTTTWARRPSRTCWRSGSRTACSSRSGTATSSTTSRSPRPRTSASGAGPATTTPRARCATWSQNHMLQLLTPALHGAAGRRSPPTRCATRRSRCCTRSSSARPRRGGARAVHGRLRGGRGGGGLPRRGGRARRLHDRDLRGPAARGRQLALGRRADLPAHRQAAGAQGHRDRGDLEAGAPPGLRGRRARWACSPTSWC